MTKSDSQVIVIKMDVFQYTLLNANHVQISLGRNREKLRYLLFATANCKISKVCMVNLSECLDHQATRPEGL